ncbi:MAG TPA: MMPL family transporter [Burkholderiales bacterium]|nr:MMPL family transporter [Burkholderiales bacterium]
MGRRALAWASGVIVLAVICALQLTSGQRVQTDLLAMLPQTERNAVAEAAATRLGELAGKRAVFLVSAGTPERSKAAARAFGERLASSGAFARVQIAVPPIDPASVARFYGPYRFRVAAEGERLGADASMWRSRLDARLASPLAGVPGAGVDVDPFGTLERFVAELPFRNLRLQVDDGLLVARDGDALHVLITAELAGSPYTPEVQRASLDVVNAAAHALAAEFSDASILRTGTVFFGAAARESAERDTQLIGAGSLAGIALLLLVLFRSARHLLLGLACVGTGLLTATVLCLAFYREINLLTLVAGSSLIGVVIDYPLQYFARHLEAEAWRPLESLREITPAIAIGVASAVLGYGALFIAPFPGLRQIAMFSVVGLLSAFATVYLLLPYGLARPLAGTAKFPLWPRRILSAWRHAFPAKRAAMLLGVVAIALLPALPQLGSDDDVRALIAPPRALVASDARIRELIGFSATSQFFLVEGRTEGEVLEREERLRERLAPLVRSGELRGYQAISSFVPSPRQQQLTHAQFTSGAAGFKPVLLDAGFRPEVVARFDDVLRSEGADTLTIKDWMQAPFSIPFRHLWLEGVGAAPAAAVLPGAFKSVAALAAAAHDLPGVTFVDKAGSVSALFGEYRRLTALTLALAFPLVGIGLAMRYGLRGALAVLVPPLFGVAAALAATAYAGMSVSLFSVLALILVLGIGVDYAVFLREGGARLDAALLGVVLAAITTLLSFGLLAMSSTPALQSFGFTLAVGVTVAALLSPTVLSFRGRAR